jgi:hypothetical protein
MRTKKNLIIVRPELIDLMSADKTPSGLYSLQQRKGKNLRPRRKTTPGILSRIQLPTNPEYRAGKRSVSSCRRPRAITRYFETLPWRSSLGQKYLLFRIPLFWPHGDRAVGG